MTVEIEGHNEVDIVSAPTVMAEVAGKQVAVTEGTTDLEVTVNRKEYKIVGDEVYIPKLYEDAPQWMKELVNIVVDISVASNNSGLIDQMNALISALAGSTVPLNTFTQSIISLNTEDSRLNSVIETLNSNYSDSTTDINAQILDIRQTYTSKDEASATAAATLEAHISNSSTTLGSILGNLQTVVVEIDKARASDYTALESAIASGLDAEETARATAVQYLNTYVGVVEDTTISLLSDVEILQKQNDGIIQTYTGTTDVMANIETPTNDPANDELLDVYPYNTWLTIEDKSIHTGDVYILYTTVTGSYKEYVRAYKFIKTIVDEPTTDADGFTWSVIVDTDAQNAYVAALNAYDLADDKRRVFTNTPTAPIDEGDLWIDSTSESYKITKVYTDVGTWIKADEQTDNFAVEINDTIIPALEAQIDKKITYYYQLSTDPDPDIWVIADDIKHNGDILHYTDLLVSYYFDSSTGTWREIKDQKALDAIADAAAAREIADKKITSYYIDTLTNAQSLSSGWSTQEKLDNQGDLVVIFNDTIENSTTWRWNGTSWVTTRDKQLVSTASSITELETALTDTTGTATVNGASTFFNTLSGATSLSNYNIADLESTVVANKSQVESAFGYASNLNIDTNDYITGFEIVSGITDDGTHIVSKTSEFNVSADTFKLIDPTSGNIVSMNEDGMVFKRADGTEFKYVQSIKPYFGAVSGEPITVPNMDRVPEVLISPASIPTYHADRSDQDQSLLFTIKDTITTNVGAPLYEYTFTPVATLNVSAGVLTGSLNGEILGSATNTVYTDPFIPTTDLGSISIRTNIKSVRTATTSGTYYNRTASLRVQVNGVSVGTASVVSLSGNLSYVSTEITYTGSIPIGSSVRLMIVYSDAGGTFTSSIAYDYYNQTLYETSDFTVSGSNWEFWDTCSFSGSGGSKDRLNVSSGSASYYYTCLYPNFSTSLIHSVTSATYKGSPISTIASLTPSGYTVTSSGYNITSTSGDIPPGYTRTLTSAGVQYKDSFFYNSDGRTFVEDVTYGSFSVTVQIQISARKAQTVTAGTTNYMEDITYQAIAPANTGIEIAKGTLNLVVIG